VKNNQEENMAAKKAKEGFCISFVSEKVSLTAAEIDRIKAWKWYDNDPYHGQCLLSQCTPHLGVLLEQITNAYRASEPISVKRDRWGSEKEIITPSEAINRFGGFSLRYSRLTSLPGSPTPEAVLKSKNPACQHIWRALKELEFLRPDLIRVTKGGVVRLKGHDPNFGTKTSVGSRSKAAIDPAALDSILSQYTRGAASGKRNR
jgi:hypothetical protein